MNLANTYLALNKWGEAATSYRNALSIYPNDDENYKILAGLYHDRLFAFENAFALHMAWAARHPDDLLARASLAQAALTTGRLEEAEKQSIELRKNPRMQADTRAVLCVIEVAALLAQKNSTSIAGKLQELQDLISAQPDELKVKWNWDGVVHFIQTDNRFESVRSPLISLLTAFQAQDRTAILIALRDSLANFSAAPKP